jgi:hypothetical protein
LLPVAVVVVEVTVRLQKVAFTVEAGAPVAKAEQVALEDLAQSESFGPVRLDNSHPPTLEIYNIICKNDI